jgi:hypothetical protein
MLGYFQELSRNQEKLAQKYGALGREIKETVYNDGYFGRLRETNNAP